MSTQQTPTLNTSLSSLAMLSLRMQEGKDYLDYLEGFVLEAIRQLPGKTFDAAKIQEIVKQEFGLRIPTATFVLYLKRLIKPGIVRSVSQGLYCVEQSPVVNVNAERDVARGKIKTVILKLQEHAQATYSQSWNEEECAAALTEFLRDYSIEFVRFTEFKSPLPDPKADNKTIHYIVASFIRHCADAEPGVFESIKMLVQSHILANALLCPDLRECTQGFKGVHFVVDTRFLLKALDLESQFDTDNIRQLLGAIQRLKGTLCIFPETKNEVRSVLRWIIDSFRQQSARGPQAFELRKRNRGVADVIMAENNLEERLKELNITTLPSPNYESNTYQFQIDENELQKEIEEEIGYAAGKAVEHDIRAVRSIFALRRGRQISRIEESGYVFLTTNSALSRAAFNYERANGHGWIFSAVITDYHLSHLAWLKAPVDSGNLSRTEILASCYAAMRPNDSFWRRYIAELERLKSEGKVSEHDHEVLRFSLKAPEELMEVTRGESDGISEKNLHTLLERLERTYAADKEKELQRERSDHEKTKVILAEYKKSSLSNERLIADATARQATLEQENLAQEREIQRLKEFEGAAKLGNDRRRDRINQFSHAVAEWVFYILGVVFFVVTVLSSFFGFVNFWFTIPVSILSFFSIWTGFSGDSASQHVKNWVAKKLSHFAG